MSPVHGEKISFRNCMVALERNNYNMERNSEDVQVIVADAS